jgi:hypothetical protein
VTAPLTPRRWQLPWPVVTVVDLFIVLTVTASAIIILSGGLAGRVGGVPFTARNPERPVITAVLLLLVRRLFAPDHGAFGTNPGSTRRLVTAWVQPGADAPAAAAVFGGPSRRALGLAALGYAAVAVLMLHVQLGQMRSVPDLGDPLFSMWRIGWVFHQLQGDPRSLFDANIFHPSPLTLTYSDSMLLTSALAAPLLAAGIAPAVTYNVLMVSSFLLSAIATYLLVVRLTGSARAAFIAGLFYGFHPFRFEHYSHLELQMTHWMPLALLALHRFADTRRMRDALLVGACVVAQLYSSMYYAVFFPFYVTAVFGTLVVLARLPVRRLIAPLAVAGVLAAALAVPLARPYVAAQPAKGDRPLVEVDVYSALASDYLRAHHRSALYGNRMLERLQGERALFPGFVVIILALLALVPPIGPIRIAYLAGLLLAFDMSMGLNGAVYEYLYDWFSPVRGMRVPARASIILGISLAVLAAFSVRSLLARVRTERGRALAFSLIVLAFLVDLRPTIELEPVWPTPPAIYAAISGRDDVVLAEFPFSIDGSIDALPQMYFSIWHGRAMINGYSGFFPSTYDPLLNTIWKFPGPETLEAFRARGVTHITVTCGLMRQPADCDDMLRRVESSPSFRQVAASRWEGQPARLYEMLP